MVSRWCRSYTCHQLRIVQVELRKTLGVRLFTFSILRSLWPTLKQKGLNNIQIIVDVCAKYFFLNMANLWIYVSTFITDMANFYEMRILPTFYEIWKLSTCITLAVLWETQSMSSKVYCLINCYFPTLPQIARFNGPTCGPLGPVGPRLAPSLPHEPCC